MTPRINSLPNEIKTHPSNLIIDPNVMLSPHYVQRCSCYSATPQHLPSDVTYLPHNSRELKLWLDTKQGLLLHQNLQILINISNRAHNCMIPMQPLVHIFFKNATWYSKTLIVLKKKSRWVYIYIIQFKIKKINKI